MIARPNRGEMPTSFDVLIVGAGSAGCVLAARLSENPALRVGLIEAGGPATDPDIAIPQAWPTLAGRDYDWRYRTTPQAWTAGRSHEWPRGRLIGGSSCLHAMAHMRGHPRDFDAWAEATGCALWSYEGLLPAFRRMESFSGGASLQHGADGPLTVMLPDAELSPVVRAYMSAAGSLGIPWLGDHNAGRMAGVAPNSLTIREGRRVTSASAWLDPARARLNLTVISGALAERLQFSGTRITGVVTTLPEGPVLLSADTIILCAGAIGTPLLLMRSGVGPAADLARAGIDCRIDLAGVGANLHDHLLTAGNLYLASQPVPPSKLQHSESMTYLNSADLTQADAVPDIVVGCVAAPAVTECFERPTNGSAYTLLSGVTHPTSRGSITITGPSAQDAPRIDPAYLSTEHDRRLMRVALDVARRIGAQKALARWRAAEIYPGPHCQGDAELDTFLQRAVWTHHHPVGTCRMGADSGAVVDASLRVNDIDNLYAVDASVIPAITTGPVHAAVLAIAETFAASIAAPLFS